MPKAKCAIPDPGPQSSLRLNRDVEASLRKRAEAAGRTLAMEIHLNLSLSLGLLNCEQERLSRPVDALEGHYRITELHERVQISV